MSTPPENIQKKTRSNKMTTFIIIWCVIGFLVFLSTLTTFDKMFIMGDGNIFGMIFWFVVMAIIGTICWPYFAYRILIGR